MESELKCPCCQDFYNDPVFFPCAHSLCRQCLRGIFSAKVDQAFASRKRSPERILIPCPSCRKEVNLSSNEIDSMQSNFQLSNIVIKYKESIQDAVKDFDVITTRRTDSNSGYVHMKTEEEIEDENPYVKMDGLKNRHLSKIFGKQEDDSVYEELDIRQKAPESLQRTEKQPILPKAAPRWSLERFSESCAINTSSAPVCPDERPPMPIPRSPSPRPRLTSNEIQQQIIVDLERAVAYQASNKNYLKPEISPRCINNRHSMHLPLNKEDGAQQWRKNAIRRKSDTGDLRYFQNHILRKRSPIDEKVTPINELSSTDQSSPSDVSETVRLRRDPHRRLSTPPKPGPKPNKKEIARIKRASTIE